MDVDIRWNCIRNNVICLVDWMRLWLKVDTLQEFVLNAPEFVDTKTGQDFSTPK